MGLNARTWATLNSVRGWVNPAMAADGIPSFFRMPVCELGPGNQYFSATKFRPSSVA